MANGFNVNSGVPRRGGRVNPQGVRSDLPALAVPSNVPFVTPGDKQQTFQPDAGALKLARAIGNINFGALATSFALQNQRGRAQRDEAERLSAQAETARALSVTGKDLSTLINEGVIPAHKSPAAQLGQGIAYSQAVFMKMRTAAEKRGRENAGIGNFYDDAEFMTPYYAELQNVRPEAVVQYFIEPAQRLAKDDAVRVSKFQETQFQQNFIESHIAMMDGAIRNGDDAGAALNNSINQMYVSGMATPENIKTVLLSLQPTIQDAARNPETGEINMAKVGSILRQIGNTRIDFRGGRKEFASGGVGVAALYHEAFSSLEDSVYGTTHRQYQAWRAQQEVQEANNKDAYYEQLDQNGSTWNSSQAVAAGRELGLSAEDSLKQFKAWNSSEGNVSGAEQNEAALDNERRAFYEKQTTAELEAIKADINSDKTKTPKEIQADRRIIQAELDKRRNRANPFADGGSGSSKSIADRFSSLATDILWAGETPGVSGRVSWDSAINSMANRTNADATKLKRSLEEPIIDAVENAATRHPRYADLLSAIEQEKSGQAVAGISGPIKSAIISDVLTSERMSLGRQMRKALQARDPVAEMQKLDLQYGTAQPAPKPARQTSRPQPARQQSTATPKQKPNLTKTVAKAKQEFRNGGKIYQLYAAQLRKNNPNLSDKHVRHRFDFLSPGEIFQLAQILGLDQ